MSEHSNQQRIPLFLTPEHPCPYLPGQTARTAFVGTEVEATPALYDALLNLGYRRSGKHIYRPYCAHCSACESLRLPVADFQPNRSQRRCLQRNEDLQSAFVPAQLNEDHWALYQRYINSRHQDGDMYPAEREQFFQFLLAPWSDSRLLEIRLDGELLACAVIDVSRQGYSAVYSFFAPEQAARSLGVYAVLNLLAYARLEKLPYVYLGYYIAACRKMSYKSQYRPAEIWRENRWQILTSSKRDSA